MTANLSSKYPSLDTESSTPVAEKNYKGITAIKVASRHFSTRSFRNANVTRSHWVAFSGSTKVAAGKLDELAAKFAVAEKWNANGRIGGYDGLLNTYTEAGL